METHLWMVNRDCRRRAGVAATDDASVLPLTHKSRHNFRISVSPDYIRPLFASCDLWGHYSQSDAGIFHRPDARGSAAGHRGPGGRPGGVRPARRERRLLLPAGPPPRKRTQDRRGDCRAQKGGRARAGLRGGARRARRALRAPGSRPRGARHGRGGHPRSIPSNREANRILGSVLRRPQRAAGAVPSGRRSDAVSVARDCGAREEPSRCRRRSQSGADARAAVPAVAQLREVDLQPSPGRGRSAGISGGRDAAWPRRRTGRACRTTRFDTLETVAARRTRSSFAGTCGWPSCTTAAALQRRGRVVRPRAGGEPARRPVDAAGVGAHQRRQAGRGPGPPADGVEAQDGAGPGAALSARPGPAPVEGSGRGGLHRRRS